MIDLQINTLGYYVDRIFSNMVRFLNNKLEEQGLEFQHPHFTILMVLSKIDGIDQTALTDFINRDKASVSRNIKYLEEKEYLERKLEGRKKKKVFLTEKGKEIIPVIYEISRQNRETTLKEFSEKERKKIFDMVIKMYHNTNALEKINKQI